MSSQRAGKSCFQSLVLNILNLSVWSQRRPLRDTSWRKAKAPVSQFLILFNREFSEKGSKLLDTPKCPTTLNGMTCTCRGQYQDARRALYECKAIYNITVAERKGNSLCLSMWSIKTNFAVQFELGKKNS